MNQQYTDELGRATDTFDVFVYGTLLKDECNHFLLGDAEFLGDDQLANAQMFNLGEYPMIVPGESVIQGEVYRVSLQVLQQLDILEEHPNYYQRGAVVLQSGHHADVYWGMSKFTTNRPVIVSGSWRSRVNLC